MTFFVALALAALASCAAAQCGLEGSAQDLSSYECFPDLSVGAFTRQGWSNGPLGLPVGMEVPFQLWANIGSDCDTSGSLDVGTAYVTRNDDCTVDLRVEADQGAAVNGVSAEFAVTAAVEVTPDVYSVDPADYEYNAGSLGATNLDHEFTMTLDEAECAAAASDNLYFLMGLDACVYDWTTGTPTEDPTSSPTKSPTRAPTTSTPTTGTPTTTPAPTPKPTVTDPPTRRPTYEPTERPTSDEVITTSAPTPGPVTHNPTPRPVTSSPTPRPVTSSPTPRPVTDSPTPRPVTASPTPRPVTPLPTPGPVDLGDITPQGVETTTTSRPASTWSRGGGGGGKGGRRGDRPGRGGGGKGGRGDDDGESEGEGEGEGESSSDGCQTAWAYFGGDDTRDYDSKCFLQLSGCSGGDWGWTTKTRYLSSAQLNMELFADAEECDYEANGELVGAVAVSAAAEGSDGVDVAVDMADGFCATELQIHLGGDKLPEVGGQFSTDPNDFEYVADNLNYETAVQAFVAGECNDRWIAVHVRSCPCPV